MWGETPFDQLSCRIAFKALRYDGQITPSLSYCGNLGITDRPNGTSLGSTPIVPLPFKEEIPALDGS